MINSDIIDEVITEATERQLNAFQTAYYFVERVKEQYTKKTKPDKVYKIIKGGRHIGYRYVKFLKKPFPTDSLGREVNADIVDEFTTIKRNFVDFLIINKQDENDIFRQLQKYVHIDCKIGDGKFRNIPVIRVLQGTGLYTHSPNEKWNNFARKLKKEYYTEEYLQETKYKTFSTLTI